MRLHVKPQPVLEVAARFPVLEQDEGGNTQYGDDVLQKDIHRDSEHLPLQESAEHVLNLQIEERDLRRQIPRNRCHCERHISLLRPLFSVRIASLPQLTPAVPLATKNSPSRRRPEAMRHSMAPRKCRVWL